MVVALAFSSKIEHKTAEYDDVAPNSRAARRAARRDVGRGEPSAAVDLGPAALPARWPHLRAF